MNIQTNIPLAVVRHKKSKKLYCVLGLIPAHIWDIVVYRCDDTGKLLPRDGTRIRVDSLELVPDLTGRYI